MVQPNREQPSGAFLLGLAVLAGFQVIDAEHWLKALETNFASCEQLTYLDCARQFDTTRQVGVLGLLLKLAVAIAVVCAAPLVLARYFGFHSPIKHAGDRETERLSTQTGDRSSRDEVSQGACNLRNCSAATPCKDGGLSCYRLRQRDLSVEQANETRRFPRAVRSFLSRFTR